MTKPTILLVYEMLGGVANGARIYTQMLQQALTEAGFRAPILTAKYPRYPEGTSGIIELPSFTFYPGCQHRFVRYWPPIPKKMIFQIGRGLNNLQAIVCNGPYRSAFVAADIARAYQEKTGRKIPTIMINHTQQELYLEKWGAPGFIKNWWMNRVVKACQLFDLNIAFSKSLQENMQHWGIAAIHLPIGLIPVLEPPESKEQLRKQLGYSLNHFIYLYTGRLTVEKNIETLLRAFAIAGRANQRTILVLVGGGKIARYQKLAQKLGIDRRQIDFVGQVEHSLIGQYYKLADAFVIASLTENSPITIIEALQFGLPIVAFAAGGIPEICGEANLLLVYKHSEHLANSTSAHIHLAAFMHAAGKPDYRQKSHQQSLTRYRTAGYDMATHLPKLLAKIEEIRSAAP